jgi:hypothetical protein
LSTLVRLPLKDTYAGVRYRERGALHGHVESYYMKANDPEGQRALWLKATIYASKRDPSRAIAESWAIAFDRKEGHVAVKTSVPYAAAHFSKDDLDIAIDGSTYTRKAWRGRVETGERSIAYDVRVSGETAPLLHFPYAWMYGPTFPGSKIVTLVPDARADGKATVNGKTWDIAAWPMTIQHNWGLRHTPSYAWGHCNVWQPNEALMFEGFSGRISLGPVLSPPSTFLFARQPKERGAGEDRLARRSFLGTGRVDEAFTLRRWRFGSTWNVEGGKASIVGELWGETDDFVGLYYANPDGTMTYCLNTKLASGELVLKMPGRGERLYRTRAAALEIATSDPNHGVRMYV